MQTNSGRCWNLYRKTHAVKQESAVGEVRHPCFTGDGQQQQTAKEAAYDTVYR